MKRNNNKKGFTIVELVIVIGVIGILSAILIPTFANLTDNANKAKVKEECGNAYTMYVMDASDDTPFTPLAREKVALKKVTGETTKWYTYSEANGWAETSYSTAPVEGKKSGAAAGYNGGYIVYDNTGAA